jgi:hypothetical protein
LLQGWGINGSINMVSGIPLDISDTTDDVAGTGGGARWSLFGPATPFNKVLGGAGTIACYGLSTSKLVTSSGSPCITVANGTGTIGSNSFVSNFPTACVAGATAVGASTAPGVTQAASPTNYNGLAQLATIGCYEVNGSAMVPPANFGARAMACWTFR